MSFYRPTANCQLPNLGGKWEALFGGRPTGYFVEVGAYDGENFSNTSCLVDVGWSGLYIEPIAESAEKCRMRHVKNAGVSVLVTAVAEKAGVTEIFVGDTLSTIVGEQVADYEKIDWAKGLHQGQKREVATETLDALLERHSRRRRGRISEETAVRPKPMIEIGGRPILLAHNEALRRARPRRLCNLPPLSRLHDQEVFRQPCPGRGA